jgi:hypothetical protein
MLKRNVFAGVAIAAMTSVPFGALFGAVGCNMLSKSGASDAAPSASAATSTTPAATTTVQPEPSAPETPAVVPHHLLHPGDGGAVVAGDGAAPPNPWVLPSGFPSTLPPIPSILPKTLPSGFPTALPSGFPSVLPSGWPQPPH